MLRRGGEAGRPREGGAGVGVGCGLKRVTTSSCFGGRGWGTRGAAPGFCRSSLRRFRFSEGWESSAAAGGFGGPRWQTWACGVGLKMSLFSCPFGPFSPLSGGEEALSTCRPDSARGCGFGSAMPYSPPLQQQVKHWREGEKKRREKNAWLFLIALQPGSGGLRAILNRGLRCKVQLNVCSCSAVRRQRDFLDEQSKLGDRGDTVQPPTASCRVGVPGELRGRE